MRSLVVDGNFKANHLRQSNASDDVYLLNGDAFTTDPVRYNLYLQEATGLSSRYRQVRVYIVSVPLFYVKIFVGQNLPPIPCINKCRCRKHWLGRHRNCGSCMR